MLLTIFGTVSASGFEESDSRYTPIQDQDQDQELVTITITKQQYDYACDFLFKTNETFDNSKKKHDSLDQYLDGELDKINENYNKLKQQKADTKQQEAEIKQQYTKATHDLEETKDKYARLEEKAINDKQLSAQVLNQVLNKIKEGEIAQATTLLEKFLDALKNTFI